MSVDPGLLTSRGRNTWQDAAVTDCDFGSSESFEGYCLARKSNALVEHIVRERVLHLLLASKCLELAMANCRDCDETAVDDVSRATVEFLRQPNSFYAVVRRSRGRWRQLYSGQGGAGSGISTTTRTS